MKLISHNSKAVGKINQILNNKSSGLYIISGPRFLHKTETTSSLASNVVHASDFLSVGSSIDDSRSALAFALHSPIYGDQKILCVYRSWTMADAALDLYLKISEESPAYLSIFLIVEDDTDLLPALSSRSRGNIRFVRLSRDDLKTWALSENLALHDDSLSAADGRPALYEMLATRPDFLSFYRFMISDDHLFDVLGKKDVIPKCETENERAALCIMMEQSAKQLIRKGKIDLAYNILNLSSNFFRAPSMHLLSHLNRAVLDVLM